jgi:hypothetical protein
MRLSEIKIKEFKSSYQFLKGQKITQTTKTGTSEKV